MDEYSTVGDLLDVLDRKSFGEFGRNAVLAIMYLDAVDDSYPLQAGQTANTLLQLAG